MWKFVLSKRQMLDQQFRRQRSIDRYIVDFVCLPLKLIIEVDGYSHQIPEVEARDQVRQEQLESLGFIVMRFTNEEIYKNLDQVRDRIESLILGLSGNK